MVDVRLDSAQECVFPGAQFPVPTSTIALSSPGTFNRDLRQEGHAFLWRSTEWGPGGVGERLHSSFSREQDLSVETSPVSWGGVL